VIKDEKKDVRSSGGMTKQAKSTVSENQLSWRVAIIMSLFIQISSRDDDLPLLQANKIEI